MLSGHEKGRQFEAVSLLQFMVGVTRFELMTPSV